MQMTLGESRNKDWHRYIDTITAPIYLSISSSILLSLINKTVYRNSSTWNRSSAPAQRRQVTLMWWRTMALEVLILTPATSHLAANHPSAHWRPWFYEASRTTSSVKKAERKSSLLFFYQSSYYQLSTNSDKVNSCFFRIVNNNAGKHCTCYLYYLNKRCLIKTQIIWLVCFAMRAGVFFVIW